MKKQFLLRSSFAIALGAIAGALSRYYLGLSIAHLAGTPIPYGTLVINVTGCFVMGFLVTLLPNSSIGSHPDIRLMVLTGFLGSYTTFSTYELDSIKLLQQNYLEPALLYWAGSAILGLLGLQLGILSAKWCLQHRKPNHSI
jgi:fluoride exporter